MGIFKNLFGNNEDSSVSNADSASSHKPKLKRTIFDFFIMDIKSAPDNTFIEAEVETNTEGDTVQNFRKTLDYKECNIFDTVEVKIIGGTRKNIFFKFFQPDMVKMETLKTLIDELYLIYGDDGLDKGKFTKKDIEDYHNNELNILFGRTWLDSKYKHPVWVNRDNDEVSIGVFGVEKS